MSESYTPNAATACLWQRAMSSCRRASSSVAEFASGAARSNSGVMTLSAAASTRIPAVARCAAYAAAGVDAQR